MDASEGAFCSRARLIKCKRWFDSVFWKETVENVAHGGSSILEYQKQNPMTSSMLCSLVTRVGPPGCCWALSELCCVCDLH